MYVSHDTSSCCAVVGAGGVVHVGQVEVRGVERVQQAVEVQAQAGAAQVGRRGRVGGRVGEGGEAGLEEAQEVQQGGGELGGQHNRLCSAVGRLRGGRSVVS